MVSATLLSAALVDFAAAFVFLFVGGRVARHSVSAEAVRARSAFAIFWLGMAIDIVITAVRELTAAFDVTTGTAMARFVGLTFYVYVFALTAAVAGLLYALLFIYTGRKALIWPVFGFYGAFFVYAAFLISRLDPVGNAPGKWFAQVAYANPTAAGAPLVLALFALLLLPQLATAIGYATLARKAPEGELKFRIKVVSTALIGWFGSSLGAPFVGLGRFEFWQAGGRLVALAAAVAIAVAYAPPASLRARWGAPQAFAAERARPEANPTRERALIARLSELV